MIDQCLNCKWITPLTGGCRAFAEIPEEIAEGVKPHEKVIEGQKGDYVFTAGESEQLLELK